ncbi:phosphate-repressible Na+/phosphate cotransporter Pho89 [Aspergillus flavus]|nr:phosphate-repressible Na+/phosphate cotransporter Pho89 [Aspergillus flavus]RAQ56076.1 phosphate-repressible Na+/phosphate cotransporter Pho89 [Aspergillus flavus]RAQ57388.1 phosphate-repressible Na+/phosphate cotransporter Pho89 [Aspergillus flavus]
MEHFAASLSQQRRLADAEECLAYVLETKRRVYGPEDPQTLETMVALGSIFTKEGRYAEAEVMTADALEMQKKSGLNILPSGTTDRCSGDDGECHGNAEKGQQTEGQRLLAHVVEMERKLFGEGHPEIIAGMKDLIFMFTTQGRWLDADELLTRVFGSDSSDDLAFIREQYKRYCV